MDRMVQQIYVGHQINKMTDLQKFKDKASTLADAFQDLRDFWTEAELPENDIADDYPFDDTFDYKTAEVLTWTLSIINIKE